MTGWVLVLDESVRDRIMTVGGYFCRWSDVPAVVSSWRDLKGRVFGLPPEAELKYTLPTGHESRTALDAQGMTQQVRVPMMLEAVAGLPIVALTDTVISMSAEAGPTDYYCDAFAWCVRRFANHLAIDLGGTEPGPHLVYVDYPPKPQDFRGRSVSERVARTYQHASTATFALYHTMYFDGEEFSLGRRGTPLSTLGFCPTLAAAHAKHSDVLQIADVVAGTFREFCMSALEQRPGQPAYPDENLALLNGVIRRNASDGSIANFGLGIWPPTHPSHDAVVARAEELCGENPPTVWRART